MLSWSLNGFLDVQVLRNTIFNTRFKLITHKFPTLFIRSKFLLSRITVLTIEFTRMAFEEHGLNEEVLSVVSKFVGGTSLEIQVI